MPKTILLQIFNNKFGHTFAPGDRCVVVSRFSRRVLTQCARYLGVVMINTKRGQRAAVVVQMDDQNTSSTLFFNNIFPLKG